MLFGREILSIGLVPRTNVITRIEPGSESRLASGPTGSTLGLVSSATPTMQGCVPFEGWRRHLYLASRTMFEKQTPKYIN